MTAVFFSQQAQLLSSALANFLLPRKCYWPRANEMSKGKKTTLWERIGQAMWAPQCVSTVGGLEGVSVISIKTGGNEHWNSFTYLRLHIEKYIYFYDMHIYLFVTFYCSCCFCFVAPMLALLILRSKCCSWNFPVAYLEFKYSKCFHKNSPVSLRWLVLYKSCNPGASSSFPGGLHDAHRRRWLLQERPPGTAEGFLRAATQRQTGWHQEAHEVLWVS